MQYSISRVPPSIVYHPSPIISRPSSHPSPRIHNASSCIKHPSSILPSIIPYIIPSIISQVITYLRSHTQSSITNNQSSNIKYPSTIVQHPSWIIQQQSTITHRPTPSINPSCHQSSYAVIPHPISHIHNPSYA